MSAEEDVIARTDAWQLAIEARDPEAVSEFLANDYALVATHPEAVVISREEWLRMLPDYDVRDYEVQHRSVEARDELAVVVQRVEMTAVVGSADRSGVFILVDIWIGEAGAWRVWRRHSTPLSAGSLPRAPE